MKKAGCTNLVMNFLEDRKVVYGNVEKTVTRGVYSGLLVRANIMDTNDGRLLL